MICYTIGTRLLVSAWFVERCADSGLQFLPISFVAAFFTINIVDYPRLSLGYVSRYVFGIGLSISFVLITVAFQVDRIRDWRHGKKIRRLKTQIRAQVDETGMKMVPTSAAVQELRRTESQKLEPPPRIFSGLSTWTDRSAATAAYSPRYGRDPEWGP